VGYDTKKTLGPKSAGADVALPIWIRIVEKLKEAGLVSAEDDYETPQGIVQVPIDLDTGYRATPGCRKVVLMAFVKGTQPTELCGEEPHAVTNLPHYLQKAMYSPKRGEQTGDEIRLTDAPHLAPAPPAAKPANSEEGRPPG
jgi:membrane carboxypeptidase/penicillin-binding protein